MSDAQERGVIESRNTAIQEHSKKLFAVTFLESVNVYREGETAGFNAEFVQRLVKAGKAKLYDPSQAAALGLAPAEKIAEEDHRTHGLSVAEVQTLVSEIDDLSILQKLWEGEQENPKSEDGRKGALDAIRERAMEVKSAIETEGNEDEDREGES